MNRRIVVVPDVHMPIEDTAAVQAVIRYIGESQPNEVVQIGDLADFPQPSSWNKGTSAEFEGSMFKDAEYIKKNFFGEIRKVYDGPIKMIPGNHEERPTAYLNKYAPALADTDSFGIEALFDFDGFGVGLIPEFYDFAHGWTMCHGHTGGISLSKDAGKTAKNASEDFSISVICGHTHRMGMVAETYGYGDHDPRVLWGVEAGHLTDMKRTPYLKGQTANWQQGFVVVDVDPTSGLVNPVLVPISKQSFFVDGVRYDL